MRDEVTSFGKFEGANMLVDMPNGSVWSVPIYLIAMSRAKYYRDKREFKTIQESLDNDTLPLFESDHYEIEDWASNNMNWDDVKDHAVLVNNGDVDFQEGWINGEKTIQLKKSEVNKDAK